MATVYELNVKRHVTLIQVTWTHTNTHCDMDIPTHLRSGQRAPRMDSS